MSDLGDDFFVDLWEEVQYVVKRKIQNVVDEKCTEMRGYYRALLKERDDTIAELENDSKPVRKKQKKKERPMHNHDPGEKPKEPCEHCTRWGDTLDFTMPGGPEYTIVPTGDGIKSFPTSEISKIELTDLRTGKRITVDEAWEIHKKHKAKPIERIQRRYVPGLIACRWKQTDFCSYIDTDGSMDERRVKRTR